MKEWKDDRLKTFLWINRRYRTFIDTKAAASVLRQVIDSKVNSAISSESHPGCRIAYLSSLEESDPKVVPAPSDRPKLK